MSYANREVGQKVFNYIADKFVNKNNFSDFTIKGYCDGR